MDAFDPARPRHTLPFDGKEYDLVGTLEVVENVEAAFREGIVSVSARVLSMGLNDTARLLAAALTACGYPAKPRELAATIHNKLGVHSNGFDALQMHLYAFLRVTLEPPEMREAMAKTMGEIVGKLPTASPGGSTKNSA